MAVPIVKAGQVIPNPALPTQVRLKAVGTVGKTDPPITNYTWTMLTWPDGSTIEQMANNGDFVNGVAAGATLITPTCYADVKGTYTFNVVATNTDGDSKPATVTVTL